MNEEEEEEDSEERNFHSKEETDEEPPVPWVNEFLEKKELLADLLDEVRRMQINGNGMEAHDKLVNIGKKKKTEKIFYTLYYTLDKTEFFIEDVREEMGEDVVDELLEFSDEYQDVATDVSTAYGVVMANFKNPISEHEHDSELGLYDTVLIEFQGYTGNSLNIELTDRPANMMSFSAMVVNSVAKGIDSLDIDEGEIDDYILRDEVLYQIDHVREHLDELEELCVKQDAENNGEK